MANGSQQFSENQTLLTEADSLAIELKYQGLGYQEIAEKLGANYSTVRSRFMRGGKLHNAYIRYAKIENEARLEDARVSFRANVKKAVQTLLDLLDSKDSRIRFSAAKEILDKTLGEYEMKDDSDEIKVIHILEAVKRMKAKEGLDKEVKTVRP